MLRNTLTNGFSVAKLLKSNTALGAAGVIGLLDFLDLLRYMFLLLHVRGHLLIVRLRLLALQDMLIGFVLGQRLFGEEVLLRRSGCAGSY